MKLCSRYNSQLEAPALTWQHQALMMIDHVVFFITLNPISACCNLSNDSSLLWSLRASLFYATSGTLWDSIKGSMIFLLLHAHTVSLGDPISTAKFKWTVVRRWLCYFMNFWKETCNTFEARRICDHMKIIPLLWGNERSESHQIVYDNYLCVI